MVFYQHYRHVSTSLGAIDLGVLNTSRVERVVIHHRYKPVKVREGTVIESGLTTRQKLGSGLEKTLVVRIHSMENLCKKDLMRFRRVHIVYVLT